MLPPLPIPALTEDEVAFVIDLIGPELETGCMPWLGKPFCRAELVKNVHGLVSLRSRSWAAHRVVYTLMRGPIPDGLVIDHLCGWASCVNPDHLEPVTSGENSRRETPRNRQRLVERARLERTKLIERAVQLGIQPADLVEAEQ
jgi:hypothetical protein